MNVICTLHIFAVDKIFLTTSSLNETYFLSQSISCLEVSLLLERTNTFALSNKVLLHMTLTINIISPFRSRARLFGFVY